MLFKILKLGQHWWIVSEEYGHIGPYNKREEAAEDKRGLMKFHKHQDELDFFTSCKE